MDTMRVAVSNTYAKTDEIHFGHGHGFGFVFLSEIWYRDYPFV
jgi:hypothetical protein